MQVFEFQKIQVSDEGPFLQHHFDAMVQFNERNNNKYFTVGYNSVRFANYVGVIQVGTLTIEILPKADNDDNSEKNIWQDLLLHMLQVCKHLKVDTITEASLKKRPNSILEVYLEMFLLEVESLIRRGLIKKYRRSQSNQNAIKGRILFSKDIQTNNVHREKVYCEHQVYDKAHIIHQILNETLLILDYLISDRLKGRLNRVALYFNNLPRKVITTSHFNRLHLNRSSTAYSKAMEIAQMILFNYSPNLNKGKDNMLTLLFDMNKLWEEYIYRTLYMYGAEKYDINGQSSTDFWESKTIRPDIVLTNRMSEETYIIDTKWKIVQSDEPSDDDLKQMFAYNLYWDSSRSMLLYPRIQQSDSAYGKFHYSPLEEKGNMCKLGFVSVVNNGELVRGQVLAESILSKLLAD